MAKYNTNNLVEVKKQKSLLLNSLIKKGQWADIASELNRICNVIPILDEVIGSEFVSAVLKEATDEYGTDELVSGGSLYLEDFKPLEETMKEIETACGDKVQVKVIKCNSPYDSQIMENYYDYLTLNNKKVLSVSITQEELTQRACGLETYNKLRDLILNKAKQAITKFIRDRIFCLINDSRNYKQIVEIPYDCDDCDGDNILSAITRFSSNLQLTAKNYNIAGRDYEIPRKTQMWLIKSVDLEAKISNILAGKFNTSAIDIDAKFARVFEEPKFRLADGLIMDAQWLQVKQVKQSIYWDFNSRFLTECGNYHYWFKDGAIKFLMAVPFRLVKISSKDKESASAIVSKVQAMTDSFIIIDETDTKTQIQDKINKLNISDPKLNLTYLFTEFNEPTKENDGSIKVSVEIKDAKGTLLNTANQKFTLKKRISITELIKVVNLSGENVPVPTNNSVPQGGQIVNAVIAKNLDATINDFNIPNETVQVVTKPVDGEDDAHYIYGTYKAILIGAGKYFGELEINGTFGRLIPTKK